MAVLEEYRARRAAVVVVARTVSFQSQNFQQQQQQGFSILCHSGMHGMSGTGWKIQGSLETK
jgi:hypothetical protein